MSADQWLIYDCKLSLKFLRALLQAHHLLFLQIQGKHLQNLRRKCNRSVGHPEVQKNVWSMGGLHFEKMKLFNNIILHVRLTNFLKTNLMKFAVIWVKRHQTVGFLSPRSSKSTVTKEKERRKRKSKEKERRTWKKKSNGCTLSFYNGYFGETVGCKFRSIWQ